MEIRGKIIQSLPKVEGVSKAGNAWKKKEYVLETQETYPKKVFFNFFGDRVDQFPLEVGEDVIISFDIESREFNGRWYTDIRAWKAEKAGQEAPAQNVAQEPPFGGNNYGAPAVDPFASSANETDDLPF